jgi:hypothetical protein
MCEIFGFAVDSYYCQILFDRVVMNFYLSPQFTIQPVACFFKAARALDDEMAHFWLEPIFPYIFFTVKSFHVKSLLSLAGNFVLYYFNNQNL